MKSAFGSKRKPRKIAVDEDDDVVMNDTTISTETAASRKFALTSVSATLISLKPADKATPESSTTKSTNVARKPFRKSALRQSIIPDDDLESGDNGTKDEQGDGPVVVRPPRPGLGRTGSAAGKKKKATSRLSFGPGEIISGDSAEALEDETTFTPKKAGFGRRVIENNALRKSLPGVQNLSIRSGDDDDERPTYSKDYLNELKSSTPSTPKDLRSLSADEEEISLDPSELEGATVVDVASKFGTRNFGGASAIPTEAEIREKKERRARLAAEPDFISLNDDGGNGVMSLLPRRKKAETRLVRDDEDFGEGFDEFVDDGRISLGKKAERAERKKKRAAMADLIHEAEGSSGDDSDDSEVERRIAYEAAQTRAGMDGLKKADEREAMAAKLPPKIGVLPNLNECLEKLQRTMGEMEMALAHEKRKMEGLRLEKSNILAREVEVQRLMNEAGARYAAMRGDKTASTIDTEMLMDTGSTNTPALPADRGLESFGSTPVNAGPVQDIG
jgi:hypothetical protein